MNKYTFVRLLKDYAISNEELQEIIKIIRRGKALREHERGRKAQYSYDNWGSPDLYIKYGQKAVYILFDGEKMNDDDAYEYDIEWEEKKPEEEKRPFESDEIEQGIIREETLKVKLKPEYILHAFVIDFATGDPVYPQETDDFLDSQQQNVIYNELMSRSDILNKINEACYYARTFEWYIKDTLNKSGEWFIDTTYGVDYYM